MTRCIARSALASVAIIGAVLAQAVPAHAQDNATTLTIEPHCTMQDRTGCPAFRSEGNLLHTDTLNIGDIVDVDIVLRSSAPSDIGAVRSWLAYDPRVLEARSIELAKEVDTPYPGERDIDARMGLVKIGGEIHTPLQKNIVTIARVTFRIVAPANDATVKFHLFLADGNGNTTVRSRRDAPRDSEKGGLPQPPCIESLAGCKSQKIALLTTEPLGLSLHLPSPPAPVETTPATPSPTEQSAATIAIPPVEAGAPPPGTTSENRSVFALLQVSGLRATTRGTDLYLGWNPLSSSELMAYNVYYGTTTGQYMLRKTVPSTMQSITIRDLPDGTTYFAAIRAVSKTNVESAFSQEVSVKIGTPDSSSAPLRATVTTAVEQERSVNAVRERKGTTVASTGSSLWVICIIVLSAIVGTLIAAKRNFSSPIRRHA